MDPEYSGDVAAMTESNHFASSDESSDDDLLLLYVLMRRRKRRAKRRFWVHPLLKRRKELGAHETLFKEMANTDQLWFRNYLRMTVIQYEDLLLQVGPKLVNAPTGEDVISPSEKLMLTLRYLATGESFISLQGQFRIGVSTIQKIVPQVLKVIWETLQPVILKAPDCPEAWQIIIDDFNEKWQFPHCWGAMDGKHVVMEAEAHSGSVIFNYKHQHSLNLLALCDAKYRFIMVDVGARGRQSDGGVFRNSNFGKRLFDRTLNLPLPSELYAGSSLIPQVCVADEAFPLDMNIMRPFPGRSTGRLPNDQKVFNYRLSRARRVIENTFGIISDKWRIFRMPIKGKINLIKYIILGAVCLHNFLLYAEEDLAEDERQYCPNNLVDRREDGEVIHGEWRQDFQMNAFAPNCAINRENLAATLIRDKFMEYFMEEGQVPWQQRRVDEGSF